MWKIDALSQSIANYRSDLGDREYSEYFGPTLWFRQAKRLGNSPLPNTVEPRIVDLTIITRAELPPASITLQTCAHAIPLPTAPNLYRIHLYLLADTTYTIDCDNQAVTSAYLQNFCFAFVDARSTPLPYSRAYDAFGYILPILAWMAFVVVALHASRASSTLA